MSLATFVNFFEKQINYCRNDADCNDAEQGVHLIQFEGRFSLFLLRTIPQVSFRLARFILHVAQNSANFHLVYTSGIKNKVSSNCAFQQGLEGKISLLSRVIFEIDVNKS